MCKSYDVNKKKKHYKMCCIGFHVGATLMQQGLLDLCASQILSRTEPGMDTIT